MSLRDKLLKNSTIKLTSPLAESSIFGESAIIDTGIPMLNVACSGKLDGGLGPGLLMIAGPSKHFKTAFSLVIAAAFLRANKDGILLFYNSEFGTPPAYFESFGIDVDKVVHTPITDVEQLKHDVMTQLNNVTDSDKLMIVIDSIGNLASKKEVDDAIEGKNVADMTRAKAFKSLFRMVTPHLNLKQIPMIVVNHTYKEIGLFPKDIVGGGTGSYYSSDTIWIVSRSQNKEADELTGYNFTIKPEKSRYIKEDSRIPITVNFQSGIDKYSGLFELSLELGYIVKAGVGWYNKINLKTGEVAPEKLRAKALVNDNEFWESLIKDKKFRDKVADTYMLLKTKDLEETD